MRREGSGTRFSERKVNRELAIFSHYNYPFGFG
jgi:hypothetical protein